MSIIYDIVSMVILNSFIVFWLQLLGNRDSSSATIIFLPLIYSISESCYSSISLHIDTLSVLQILRVIFLWSLHIINDWASNIDQYYLNVLKILSIYMSVPMFLFLVLVNFLLWKNLGIITLWVGLPGELGLAVIPDYLSIRSFLNSWPINSYHWSYVISIGQGCLVIHIGSTKFAIVISHYSSYYIFEPPRNGINHCSGFQK